MKKLTDFEVEQEHVSTRNVCMEQLESNGFRRFLADSRRYLGENENPVNYCKYYSEEDVGPALSNLSGLSLLHANVRRIAKNRGQFLAFYSTLDTSFDIIVLTEIGDDAKHFIHNDFLSGYTIFLNTPTKNKYGGVAILVRNDLGNIYERSDLRLGKTCNYDKCQMEDY